MTYAEANKIGTAFDGYIKCTYAKIFNADVSEFYFSLQKRHTAMNEVYHEFEKTISDAADDVAIVYEIPVVTAGENAAFTKGGKRYIKCEITDEAKLLIMNKINSGKKSKDQSRYTAMYNAFNREDVLFAIREDAINWIPNELRDVVAGDININIDLEAARQKMERAKALLVIAGATNII